MLIETNKELKFEHLLSLRKKMTQPKTQQELQTIMEFVKANGLQKSGPTITTTFTVEHVCKIPVYDMEILVPLNNPFEATGDYVYKKYFHLVNAVCIHHVGSSAQLQNSYNELTDFLDQNRLQPITSSYHVTVREPKPSEPQDNCQIDIYIGVNPSVL